MMGSAFYHKVMWEEHLYGISLEAVRVSLAINCSMQKQQQSQMDQAQLGSIKPVMKKAMRSLLCGVCPSSLKVIIPQH